MKILFHDKPTCPKCGSYNVAGGFIEIDMGDGGQIAWQKVHCDDCGFEYTDVYRYDHSECYEDDMENVFNLINVPTEALLDEILKREEKGISGADVLLDLLVDREILAFADKDDYGLYRKL